MTSTPPSLEERVVQAAEGAQRAVILLSANPMHDTGGGQRSAQLALELLERGACVLFVSHGEVTETVELGLRYPHPRLVQTSLRDAVRPVGLAAVDRLLDLPRASVLTQVPVAAWNAVLERARRAARPTIYDCIDRWDSELGRGWYRAEVEREMARSSDLLVASAPELVRHLERLAGRGARLLPNAFNGRIFDERERVARPADLPSAERIALYVGALWGGWLDWSLMRRAAEELPGTTFVFVGDRRREGRGLPENCVFLGLKPQAELPGYLAHADLAFLPWRVDDVTRATSPLKIYEFVAMGVPVVGPDLETLAGVPGVYTRGHAAAFVEAVGRVGRDALDTETRAAMRRFSAANSWARRVDELLGCVDEVAVAPTGPTSRPAALRHPTPRPSALRTGRVISVVIPLYNHERYVGGAIESVLGQTLPAGELVVVDDGSSDGSGDVLASYVGAGVRCVRQENRGAHVAINRAIELSYGDYIAILNSDDAFTPERLEHAWGVARASRAALLVGSVRFVDDDGRPLAADHPSVTWYEEAKGEVRRRRSLRGALLRHNVAVTTSNFFVHRELWRRLGGFAAYRYVHDLDFLLRALDLHPQGVVYEESLADVFYRVHDQNTIAENTRRALDERASLLRGLRRPLGRLSRLAEAYGGARSAVRMAVEASEGLAAGGRLSPGRAGATRVEETAGAAPAAISERPLRIGVVAPSLDAGGLEEVVALLAHALTSEGLAPHVLCTHRGGAVAERLKTAGVPVTVAAGRAGEWQAWAARVEPHVLSTHFVDLEVVRALAAKERPILETVHNCYAWFKDADWQRERAKLELLAGTIAVSETVAAYHARYAGSAASTHVIPNAVDPARAAATPPELMRRQLGVAPDAPLFAHLGRFTVQKNLAGLMEAFRLVLEDVPSARLVLAGPVHERRSRRSLEARFRGLIGSGAVRLLPPQTHVGALLSAADAFVSNSFYEGWSVAASEAAWCGLPLVLSECGGSRELVGPQDERGLLVPNPLGSPLDVTAERIADPPPELLRTNERALAEALVGIATSLDEWRARRAAIRDWARMALAPERMSAGYATVLRDAAQRVV